MGPTKTMVVIPKSMTQPTVDAIYHGYEQRREPQRGHLGGSMIGRECERELWYGFRWAKQVVFNGRILRLFQRGQLEEKVFEDDLRSVGIKVETIDPVTGKQFRVSAIGGHFAGSMDGIGSGFPEAPVTEHNLEFKTHNEKSFKELQSKGVQKSKPEHYAQMQVYMLLSGLTRAFYLAVNKNNDELYSERIKVDKTFAAELIDKAVRVITASEPPKKISNDPSWFKCKFCDYSDICHGDGIAETNCRTCAHSTPILNGDADWACNKYENDKIPLDFQRKGCDKHAFINGLSTVMNDTFSALKKTSGQW